MVVSLLKQDRERERERESEWCGRYYWVTGWWWHPGSGVLQGYWRVQGRLL